MGLKEKKKPHKEKAKRKRGKKFKYDPQKEQEKEKKHNPFEEFSKKKFIKQNNNEFKQLITDYQTKNNVNLFKDNRIAENATNLTNDQKMKLRYKAQQMLKKSKKSKFAFDNEEEKEGKNNKNLENVEDDDLKLTHKGKEIDSEDSDSNNYDKDENEEYYNQMDEYIENINNNKKLTKQEKFKEIMLKSKQLKEEKQRIRENTLNKIAFLNENFNEINTLLKKRKRTFNRLNDDYDKIASNFIYSERIHPTERIKSQEEIEKEKEKKLKNMEMQRLKEEVDAEEDEIYDEDKKIEDLNEKHLTKKERIEKLIQERLGKAKKKMEKGIMNNNINLKEEDGEENDDNLIDLHEIEQGGEEEEESEDDADNDENDEDDEDENEDDDKEESNDDYKDNNEEEENFKIKYKKDENDEEAENDEEEDENDDDNGERNEDYI